MVFKYMLIAATSEQDVTTRNTGRFEVSLNRYLLSHSASISWFMRYILRLFENAILPGWMSYHVLSIGDENIKCYFELYRIKSRLPFASVAHFRVANANDNIQARTFHKDRQLDSLKLGTTDINPIDIMRTSMRSSGRSCSTTTVV
jgi:hypothetical protein